MDEEILVKFKAELKSKNVTHKVTEYEDSTNYTTILLLKVNIEKYSILGLKTSNNWPERITNRSMYIYT